jgi:hypothetical protein
MCPHRALWTRGVLVKTFEPGMAGMALYAQVNPGNDVVQLLELTMTRLVWENALLPPNTF